MRPRNPTRARAMERGDRFFCDGRRCACGEWLRYTVNNACIGCVRKRSIKAYRSMTPREKAEYKRRDQERYQMRKRRAKRRENRDARAS